ncbi:hypothetical protein ACWGBU_35705 [Streptomyces vinaceus]
MSDSADGFTQPPLQRAASCKGLPALHVEVSSLGRPRGTGARAVAAPRGEHGIANGKIIAIAPAAAGAQERGGSGEADG